MPINFLSARVVIGIEFAPDEAVAKRMEKTMYFMMAISALASLSAALLFLRIVWRY
jgi:hypothetical protein